VPWREPEPGAPTAPEIGRSPLLTEPARAMGRLGHFGQESGWSGCRRSVRHRNDVPAVASTWHGIERKRHQRERTPQSVAVGLGQRTHARHHRLRAGVPLAREPREHELLVARAPCPRVPAHERGRLGSRLPRQPAHEHRPAHPPRPAFHRYRVRLRVRGQHHRVLFEVRTERQSARRLDERALLRPLRLRARRSSLDAARAPGTERILEVHSRCGNRRRWWRGRDLVSRHHPVEHLPARWLLGNVLGARVPDRIAAPAARRRHGIHAPTRADEWWNARDAAHRVAPVSRVGPVDRHHAAAVRMGQHELDGHHLRVRLRRDRVRARPLLHEAARDRGQERRCDAVAAIHVPAIRQRRGLLRAARRRGRAPLARADERARHRRHRDHGARRDSPVRGRARKRAIALRTVEARERGSLRGTRPTSSPSSIRIRSFAMRVRP
jgi:hypothetical protein